MATTLIGKAVVWGCGDIDVAAIIVGETGLYQSQSFSREADTYDLKNNIGDTVGHAFSDHRSTFQITCIPFEGVTPTVAEAYTNALAMLPKIGTVVAIADQDAADTIIEKSVLGNSANYVVTACSMSRTNSGPAEIQMTLMRREDNDVTTTVS